MHFLIGSFWNMLKYPFYLLYEVNKYFVIFINDKFSEAYRIVENGAENPVETKITSSLIISFIKSRINCVYR